MVEIEKNNGNKGVELKTAENKIRLWELAGNDRRQNKTKSLELKMTEMRENEKC